MWKVHYFVYGMWMTKMETFVQIYCDACHGCHGKGIKICKECREIYCISCSNSHSFHKATKYHDLMDLDSARCDICLGSGIETNVRTMCKECGNFLCQECSCLHSFQRTTENHIQILLNTLSNIESSAKNHDSIDDVHLTSDFVNYTDLASDFMSNACLPSILATDSEISSNVQANQRVVDNAVLNCGQDDVQSDACAQTQAIEDVVIAENTSDPYTRLKVIKQGEFNVQRPEDKKEVFITGVLSILDKFIISDANNKRLKLFHQTGRFLSSVKTKHQVWGLADAGNNKFATCGADDRKVRLWSSVLCQL